MSTSGTAMATIGMTAPGKRGWNSRWRSSSRQVPAPPMPVENHVQESSPEKT